MVQAPPEYGIALADRWQRDELIGSRSSPRELAAERLVHASRPAGVDAMLRQAQSDGVRVFSDADATRALGVAAFTVGNQIVLGEGARNPRVVAHELAHVRLNAESPGPPLVSCFEAEEHRRMGDAEIAALEKYLQTPEGRRWAEQSLRRPADAVLAQLRSIGKYNVLPAGRGKMLTRGTIMALSGDLYASMDKIRAASPDEVAGIMKVVDARDRPKDRMPYPESQIELNRTSSGRLVGLAANNITHFTYRNRQQWYYSHLRAMVRAQRDPTQLADALADDAAACHFLTDAFAAGHLMDGEKVLPAIEAWVRAGGEPDGHHAFIVQLRTALNLVKPSGQTVHGMIARLVFKKIHDRLNEHGFNVSNARGMTWRAYGDDALTDPKTPAARAGGDETARIAAVAVTMSQAQVVDAAAGKIPKTEADIASSRDEIVDLLPSPESIDKVTAFALTPAVIQQAMNEVPKLVLGNGPILRQSVPVPILGVIFTGLVMGELQAAYDRGNRVWDNAMMPEPRRRGEW
jgi:hypothetical protein